MITWLTPTAPAAPCPECSGPRLYSMTWRHSDACPLRTQLDSTQAADYARVSLRTRPATPAELVLCGVLGWTPVAPASAVIVSRPPIWLKTYFDGHTRFDPGSAP